MTARRTKAQVWGPRFEALDELRGHFVLCCGRGRVPPSLDVAVRNARPLAAGRPLTIPAWEVDAAWRLARREIEAAGHHGCERLEYFTAKAAKAMRL